MTLMECSIDVVLDYDTMSSAANKCRAYVKQLCERTHRARGDAASPPRRRRLLAGAARDTPHLIDL